MRQCALAWGKMKMKYLMLMLVMAVSAVCNAVPLADDSSTVGLWHMDSSSGGMVFDHSANRSNDLVISNGAAITTGSQGIYGEALSFDGTNDFATAAWNGGSSFILDGWFKPGNITAFSPARTAFQMYRVAVLNFRGGGLRFAAYNNAATPASTEIIVAGVANNTWYHVIASVDEVGAMALNVFNADGSLLGSAVGNTPGIGGLHYDYPRVMYIGAAGGTVGGTATTPYIGLIDDLKVANDPLPCGLYDYPTGDFNHDCNVDFADMASIVENWLKCSTPGVFGCVDINFPQDLNHDHNVNMTDFAMFAENWLVEINPILPDFSSVTPDYSQVQLISDVAYLGAGRNEKMDVYMPLNSNLDKYPAVLIIHGGGWYGGDKHGTREQIAGTNLARQGYVCASIDYALCNSGDTGNPSWPQNIYDCKKAVQFLRRNSSVYKIDPNHIGVIGGSAGGHLAALLGVAGIDAGLEPIDGLYVGTATNVQAVIDMYGITNLATWNISAGQNYLGCSLSSCPATWSKASPLYNITSDDPPVMIIHGTADTTVPLEQSLQFVAGLQSANVHVELMKITGAPHSFAIQMKGLDLCPAVVTFFDKYLKP
jgi:acetyl esterase/lipase